MGTQNDDSLTRHSSDRAGGQELLRLVGVNEGAGVHTLSLLTTALGFGTARSKGGKALDRRPTVEGWRHDMDEDWDEAADRAGGRMRVRTGTARGTWGHAFGGEATGPGAQWTDGQMIGTVTSTDPTVAWPASSAGRVGGGKDLVSHPSAAAEVSSRNRALGGCRGTVQRPGSATARLG